MWLKNNKFREDKSAAKQIVQVLDKAMGFNIEDREGTRANKFVERRN